MSSLSDFSPELCAARTVFEVPSKSLDAGYRMRTKRYAQVATSSEPGGARGGVPECRRRPLKYTTWILPRST